LLLERAKNAGKELLDVYVSISGYSDVADYLTDAIVRPAILGDVRSVYGKARASDLVKIAQLPGVIAVVDKAKELRQTPDDPDRAKGPKWDGETALARLDELRANELTFKEAQEKAGELGASGWFDVQDGHKSNKAWEKGFTGEGVVVGCISVLGKRVRK